MREASFTTRFSKNPSQLDDVPSHESEVYKFGELAILGMNARGIVATCRANPTKQ